VEYLPLGTNPNRFRRMPPDDTRLAPFACDISFVGSSLVDSSIIKGIVLGDDPDLRKIFVECVERHAVPPHMPAGEILREIEQRMNKTVTAVNRGGFERQIEFEAMVLYRSRAINRLARFSPSVYGDGGWNSVLAEGPLYCGSIDYKGDLPFLYCASQINLNLSKSQLITSVNQRVFDAPACGGFVLTDYREDVVNLFDPDKQLAVFRDGDEMETKAAYFLENEKERESRARMTRRRVLAEHTYAHRMRRMLDLLAQYI
jgi:spore maturation protein CgeB